MNCIIRNATLSDVPFIAWAVAEAIDEHQHDLHDRYLMVCQQEDTLYSYKNTRIAEVDGKVIGCQIAFTGSTYTRLRKRSWLQLWDCLSEVLIDQAPMEADLDEYHLDSIAILPEYRGYGISQALIMDSVRIGQQLGYHHISFLVENSKDKLHAYYRRIGFADERPLQLFQVQYTKMRYARK